MADHPPPPPPSSPPPPAAPDPTQYWCYQCNKRVTVETQPNHPDITCFECKNGFVESISVAGEEEEEEDTPAFGNEFLQVLRLLAQAARDDDEPPPPPSEAHAGDNDYLRIELDGWNNGSVDVNEEEADLEDQNRNRSRSRNQNRNRFVVEDDDDEEPEEEELENEIRNINRSLEDLVEADLEDQNPTQNRNRNRFVVEDDEEEPEEEEENEIQNLQNFQNRSLEAGDEDEEDEDEVDDFVNRERRDVLRLRLRDFANRAASRRNRILDWAEILMGLEDQSIEFRLNVPGEDDNYIGNPGDYVDAAGYEALLQTLAENDNSGRRGAPPAAKSAVENLQTVGVHLVKLTDMEMEMEICAICKDKVFNDDEKTVKKLDCEHMYHEDCIVEWLGTRNTCPVCRFELATDDPEYEEDRRKKSITMAASATTATDHGCSSSSGGGGDDDD